MFMLVTPYKLSRICIPFMTDFGEESLALHATMTYGKVGDTQRISRNFITLTCQYQQYKHLIETSLSLKTER